MAKHICSNCGREFYNGLQLGGHKSSCGRTTPKCKSCHPGQKHICSICGKEFNNGLQLGGHASWCYEKDQKQRRENLSLYAQKRQYSDETRHKLSIAAKRNEFGGHTSKRKLFYNGYTLQSSYEIDFAKDLDSRQIKWTRPSPFWWTDDFGEQHRYYPDFYLVDYDIYIDTKNDYLILMDKTKIQKVIKQNKIKLYVLNKEMLSFEKLKLSRYDAIGSVVDL